MAEISREAWIQLVTEMATPINFDSLIQKGILKRRSKLKYDVMDRERLPSHVSRQVQSSQHTTQKDGPVLMTITIPDRTKTMRALLVKAVGEARADELIAQVAAASQ